jgi:hypothetical protein
MSRRLPILLVAVLALVLLATRGNACPFCNAEGQTLTKEINLASLVIFGRIHETRGGVDFSIEGWTDFIVEKVIKRHDILDKELKKPADLGGKEVVRLARYLPPDEKKQYKLVVFCDVFKGKIDPYRFMRVNAESDPSKYLAGALEVKDKSQAERLKFFFRYLDDP